MLRSENNAMNQNESKKSQDEVAKVTHRLKRWASRPQQINAKILNAFLVLRSHRERVIIIENIEDEYAKTNGPSDAFMKNFNQMRNFGEKNHGKVFDVTGGCVKIWQPVADAVAGYEAAVMQRNISAMPAPTLKPTPAFSDAEWQVRRDLAACYRLFVRYGWTDLIFTHLSARVPNHADQYLINPYGLLFHEITASNLIKVDFDGNVIAGDYPYNDAGHAIHTAILKARPEVDAVLHSHTRAGMAVACMRCGLLPITQQANEVRDLVCHHEYDLATDNEAECDRLGQDMGDKWLMLMHNHGLLSAGRTVAEAFYFLYMLENACKVQVDVMASGAEIVVPEESVLAGLADYGRPPSDAPADFVTRSWQALIRMLDQQDPSYKA